LIAALSLAGGRSGPLRLSLTLSFILVSALRAAFNFPSELGANWAFRISDTNHASACLSAMRKWIVLCAIAPLFALVAPFEFASYPWLEALFYLCFAFTLSLLLMELMFFDFRKVPFTCAYLPGKVNLVLLVVIYCFGFTLYSRTMSNLAEWLAARPWAALLFFACSAAACFGVGTWRVRLLGRETVLDFEDAGDPEVRTLELHA